MSAVFANQCFLRANHDNSSEYDEQILYWVFSFLITLEISDVCLWNETNFKDGFPAYMFINAYGIQTYTIGLIIVPFKCTDAKNILHYTQYSSLLMLIFLIFFFLSFFWTCSSLQVLIMVLWSCLTSNIRHNKVQRPVGAPQMYLSKVLSNWLLFM